MTSEQENRVGVDDSGMDRSVVFRDLAAMIWRRKWILAATLAISLAAGAAYLQQIEPYYKVSTRLLVQRHGMPLDHGRPPTLEREFLSTQAEIIVSPTVVERALAQLGPAEDGLTDEERVQKILKNLEVDPVLGTNILSIGYRSESDTTAVGTVETIISCYQDYLRELERNSHVETLRLLTRNEKELRDELKMLETQYQQLRKDSPLMGQGKDATGVQRALLTNLGQTLTHTRNRRIELENKIFALRNPDGPAVAILGLDPIALAPALPAGDPAVTDAAPEAGILLASANSAKGQNLTATSGVTGELPAQSFTNPAKIQEELFKSTVREKELLQQFGHKHPEVRAAQEQTAIWQELLYKSVEAAPALMEQELSAVRLYENNLATLYDEEFEKAKVVDGYLLTEQQALDGIKRVQTLHQSILTQVRQWQLADEALAEGRGGITVSLLEAPPRAELEVWPPPLLLFGACGLLGLVGGFGIISLVERANAKIWSTEEIQNRTNLPIYGRIPTILGNGSHSANTLYRGRLVHQLPESSTAEAFRALRTQLKNGSSMTPGLVIQLASPTGGEGKTTVTANLAFSFAQLGKRVIVIDADLRYGKLHEIFDVPTSKGLTSVLRDGMPVEEAIQRSPLATVDVLTHGPEVSNPVELLSQPQFESLLKTLREQYDLVLVDTPPLLVVTEASVLAPKTDGVLLSLMLGRSSITETTQAFELLNTLGAKTLGVVVNQTRENRKNGYVPSNGSSVAV